MKPPRSQHSPFSTRMLRIFDSVSIVSAVVLGLCYFAQQAQPAGPSPFLVLAGDATTGLCLGIVVRIAVICTDRRQYTPKASVAGNFFIALAIALFLVTCGLAFLIGSI